MFAFQPMAYTSLSDLLPPATAILPAYHRKDTWNEIPIKDPLLQRAAWAYLHPVSAAQTAYRQTFFSRLKDNCCVLFGCFGGLFNDVFVRTFRDWFPDEANKDAKDGDKAD